MSGGSLPIKKVYIDSRFKTKDSVSNSHFKYELVESLQFHEFYSRSRKFAKSYFSAGNCYL